MNKEALIEAASQLATVSSDAAAEYASRSEGLAGMVTATIGAREDLARLIGPDNRAMMADNHRNHARFIASLLQRFDPTSLVDTVIWVFRAYRAHGFTLVYWSAQLNAWLVHLEQELSPETFDAVRPLYEWLLINQPSFVELSEQSAPTAWDESEPSHG